MENIADILVFKDPGAKRVVIGLFGDDLGSKLALFMGRGKSLDWRKVLEPKDAVDQCNNTVGELGTAPCYLCGQIPDKQRKFTDPLFAECEHILPVTTARWFLTLYMNKTQLQDEWTKGLLKVEYAWAHRICNQTKSNANFLTKDASGMVVVDDASLDAVLTEIGQKASGRTAATAADRAALQAIAALATETGRAAQKQRIIAEKLQPIVDLLNKGPPDDKLLMLARTVALMDTSFLSSEANEILRTYYAEEGKTTAEAEEAIADVETTAKAFKTAVQAEVKELSNPTNLPDFIRQMLPAEYDKDVFEALVAKIEGATPTVTLDDFPSESRQAVGAEWEALSNGHKFDPVVDIYAEGLVASMSGSQPLALPDNFSLLVLEFSTYTLTRALWSTLDEAWKRKHVGFTCRLIAVQTAAATYARDFLDKGESDAVLAEHGPYKAMCDEYFASKTESEPSAKQLAEHGKTMTPTKQELKAFKQAQTPEETVTPKYEAIVRLQSEIGELKPKLNDPAISSSVKTAKEESLRKKREELLALLQDPEPSGLPLSEVNKMIAALKTKLGQGRRTRRAKLSQRTKRARRSGLSTKLRRRSFRKGQKGKSTKRSRSGIQRLSDMSSAYTDRRSTQGREFR